MITDTLLWPTILINGTILKRQKIRRKFFWKSWLWTLIEMMGIYPKWRVLQYYYLISVKQIVDYYENLWKITISKHSNTIKFNCILVFKTQYSIILRHIVLTYNTFNCTKTEITFVHWIYFRRSIHTVCPLTNGKIHFTIMNQDRPYVGRFRKSKRLRTKKKGLIFLTYSKFFRRTEFQSVYLPF